MLRFRSTLGALATITRLKIAISRLCVRSARFARASLRKMKVQIEAQERTRARGRNALAVLGCSCNAVAPISPDPPSAASAALVFPITANSRNTISPRCLSSGRTYIRMYKTSAFTSGPFTRALSRAYRGRQPRIASISRKFQSNYAVIIISHVIENTSHRGAFLLSKHPADRYYVK